MANEHHAATLVVMLQVIVPCVKHVGVGQGAIHGYGRSGNHGPQRRESDLAVHRRVNPALGSEAGKLRRHHAFFFRTRDHVAVACRVTGDRGIDVEAVDGSLGIRGPSLALELAVGGDDGCGQVNRAGVLAAGPAEPSVPVTVIVLCGSRGLGLGLGRLGRRRGSGRGLGEDRAWATTGDQEG